MLSSQFILIKFVTVFKVRFHKGDDEHTEVLEAYFQTDPAVYFKHELMPDINFDKIKERVAVFTPKGSGWIIDEITNVYVNVAEYKPLRGSSYVDLPPKIKNKKAIVNAKNKKHDCCRVAIRSAHFSATSHADSLSSYPTDDGLNFSGISEPTPITEIKKVERQNNITVNVYELEGDDITPYRISDYKNDRVIDVFLYKDHYCWIKNLDKLLNTKTKHGYHCNRCLLTFYDRQRLADHMNDCKGINELSVRVEMSKQTHVKFENYQNQLPVPYVIYADFEALNKTIKSCVPDPKESSPTKILEHEPCGFGYIVVRCDGHVEKPVLYRGHDTVKIFLEKVQAEEQKIKNALQHPRKMIYNSLVEAKFQAEDKCHICQKPFEKQTTEEDMETDALPKEDKVRDHCHITGRYRGAAHRACNLNFKFDPVIPVVFHNLRGYDAHLVMQGVGKTEGKLNCIPNNMEKYISFTLGNLRFIDSMQSMNTSLDKLANAQQKEDFVFTKKFGGRNWEIFTKKGIYPYEWMDSWEKFDYQLPGIDLFYSVLDGCGIKHEEHMRAKSVWNTFDCKNMGDYHDLYLKTDVLLLADIFEKFRKTMCHHYNLNPAHYYTSAGLAWDALLKSTGISLELFQDIDMHLFIEKGMCGGISMVSKRYVKANNKYLEDYDPSKPSTYIQYLDANNLGHGTTATNWWFRLGR